MLAWVSNVISEDLDVTLLACRSPIRMQLGVLWKPRSPIGLGMVLDHGTASFACS